MPLSIIVSNLIKLGIQLCLFLLFWAYFLLFRADSGLAPNTAMLLLPLLILIMGGIGLGFGMIISAMTTKYRDLVFLLTFGIQLLMYATPVIYPINYPGLSPTIKKLLMINPMSSVIETFRYAFLGAGGGTFSWGALCYSLVFAFVLVLLGAVVFNKVEKSFMDTV